MFNPARVDISIFFYFYLYLHVHRYLYIYLHTALHLYHLSFFSMHPLPPSHPRHSSSCLFTDHLRMTRNLRFRRIKSSRGGNEEKKRFTSSEIETVILLLGKNAYTEAATSMSLLDDRVGNGRGHEAMQSHSNTLSIKDEVRQ